MLNHHLARLINSGVRNDGLLNLSAEAFFNIPICIPSVEEQSFIAEMLQTADNEINLLNDELIVLKKQKRGLMQKLLTGTIRVKITEEI
jgi:type I restriction enzyme S subunit